MTSVTNESDVIVQLECQWWERLKAKDVDWIVGLFAKEGRWFPPGAEPVVGSKALRAAWEAMANTQGLEVSWEPTAAHVSAANDMAYDFGTVTIKTPEGRTQAGKYIVVWVRQDGAWKIAVDMFNTNTET